MREREVAVVVGVGPGLGSAIARRFARAGMDVAVAAHRGERLQPLAAEIGGRAYSCDVTREAEVENLFRQLDAELGPPSVAVYNAGAYVPKRVLETDPAEFERCWRAGCFGGLLLGQAAARRMLERGQGTLLFTGATAAWRSKVNFST